MSSDVEIIDDDYCSDDGASYGTVESYDNVEFHQNNNKENQHFEIIDTEAVFKEIKARTEDVSSFTGYAPCVSKVLLGSAFQWDEQALKYKWLEMQDGKRMLYEYNVLEPGIVFRDEPDECQICFDDAKLSEISCKHAFCPDCWDDHLRNQIETENNWLANCPGSECKGILNEELVSQLSRNDSTMAAYQKLVCDNFILITPTYRMCPGADCNRLVRALSPNHTAVKCQCECGAVFCFGCEEPSHEPVRCDLLKHWMQKSNIESANLKWISVNSKPCPKCQSPIQKNGGCNRMLCGKCRYEFCWLCLSNWNVHGYNPCNRYDEEKDKADKSARAKQETELRAFVHYFERFDNHRKGQKLEEELKKSVDEKIAKLMHEKQQSWIEVQYVNKAFDTIREARHTLMYSYAFAFYLKTNSQKEIFESNQQDLETTTENLGELLERELDLSRIAEFKQALIDKSHYVTVRRKLILEHVAECNQKKEWAFKDRATL